MIILVLGGACGYLYQRLGTGPGLLLVAAMVTCCLLLATIMIRQINSPLQRFKNDIQLLTQGRLTHLPPPASHEFAGPTQALNEFLDRMRKQIQTDEQRRQMEENVVSFLQVVSDASDGDLTVRAPVTEDAFGSIADAYNLMVESLAELLRDTNQNALEVGRESRNLLTIFQQVKQNAEIQLQHVTEVTRSADTTAESARQIAAKAAFAQESSAKVDNAATLGNAKVNKNIDGMQLIRSTVQLINKKMKMLSERMMQIGTISQLISEVATRTTILAMNASIEAARAGEQGRGFLVISDEIKRLADEASDATRQIDGIIKAIQSETGDVAAVLAEETRIVEEQTQIAQDTGEALSAVADAIQEANEVMAEITALSQNQQAISATMAREIDEMATISQQTSVHIGRSSEISEGLNRMSNNLLASLAQFTLTQDSSSPQTDSLTRPVPEQIDPS
ncbi:MAG: methyl-accepting chemotaxis protein [Desulfuromonadales bacterium]|nr:methyl-accepting chemotaxis protein [Desulfuromonadales bacterium]